MNHLQNHITHLNFQAMESRAFILFFVLLCLNLNTTAQNHFISLGTLDVNSSKTRCVCFDKGLDYVDNSLVLAQPFVKVESRKFVGYTASKNKILKYFDKNLASMPCYAIAIVTNGNREKCVSLAPIPSEAFLQLKQDARKRFRDGLQKLNDITYTIYKLTYFLEGKKHKEYLLVDSTTSQIQKNYGFLSSSVK